MDAAFNVNTKDDDEVAAAITSFHIEVESIVLNIVRESFHYNLNVTIALCTPTLIGTFVRLFSIFLI